MYQLMKVFSDGTVGASGSLTKHEKHVKRRLSKLRKGWVVQLRPEGNVIVAARGFSRDAMAAISTVGVEVVS